MAFIRRSVSLQDKEATQTSARQLPVIFLIDISGSMDEVIDKEGMIRTGRYVESDGQEWEEVTGGKSKIMVLNQAMKEMMESFKNTHSLQAEIYCHIITFGDCSDHFIRLAPASSIEWKDIKCDGNTDMAGAFRLVMEVVEDKERIGSRSFRPLIVLVSDGKPDQGSNWKAALESLLAGRSGKADRIALAIGDGESVDMNVLKEFVSLDEKKIFKASEAHQITRFFKMVTMTTQQRTLTGSENNMPSYDAIYDSIED